MGYAYDDEPECDGKSSPKIEKIEVKEGKWEKVEKIEAKEIKIEKLEKREKPEKPERKEVAKEKLEKIEKPERKELKQEKFEKLEQWENKDFSLEKFRIGEGKEVVEGPIDDLDVIQPVSRPAEELKESVSRLENTVNELRHFIASRLRPDLSQGALRDEPDVEEAGTKAPREEEDGSGHDH